MDDARRTYLLASTADWICLALLVWGAVQWFGLLPWLAVVVVVAWVVKDLLMFPFMRQYYESRAAERRIVGEEGVALVALDPHGFVRVHGEIWQAHVAPHHPPIEAGAPIRVHDVNGLELLVDRVVPPA